jgi:biopolymer transport protein TolQ
LEGIHADAELLRNQVADRAPQRCADQNECGAACGCGAQEEAMTFTELLRNIGLFVAAVICCLAALSIFSVAVMVDKYRRFRAASRESQDFKAEYQKFLHGGEVQELIDAVRKHQKSHVAQVVSAGILEYEGVREAGGDPVASLELVTSALRDSMSETLIQLKAGLGFLATIGSTAPFVGLFGTVAGIINAFRNIAATGSGGMSVVSGGIAEALVTTALGIFVAIPAVAAFNYFTGKVENFHIEMNRASTQLVNRLFKAPQQLIERMAKMAKMAVDAEENEYAAG